jgi:hypothetical protein
MCYVEDPFGIVFEIYSHSYELHYSAGAYKWWEETSSFNDCIIWWFPWYGCREMTIGDNKKGDYQNW